MVPLTGSWPRPVRRGGARVALGLAIAALTVLLAVSGSGFSSSSAAAASAGPPGSPAAGAEAAPSASGVGTPAASAHPASASAGECAAFEAAWAKVDANRPAAPVAPALQSPCELDPDVAGLYFLSSQADSGARVQFSVTLPANGTDAAGAYSAFWVGEWVTGIGCSYDDAAYLTVELIPPYAENAGVNGTPWWTVEAPVWDLVPAGACDPQCENDSATFTIDAVPYCEDDAAMSGPGELVSNPEGHFLPGDALTIALVGTAGGSSALTVYLNDTTNPTESLAWSYASSSQLTGSGFRPTTVTGTSLTPLFSTANASATGWTGGLDVGFGWDNCPTAQAGVSNATDCNSYDPVVTTGASPELTRVASWNATTKTYANLYTSVETVSSTGGCAGLAGVPGCADFTTYGGGGTYPEFGLVGGGDRAWFSYGPPDSLLDPFGATASEFPTDGTLSAPFAATGFHNASIESIGANSATISVRVSDPDGVRTVAISTWWCTNGTGRTESTFGATLDTGTFDSPYDGNWTATVPTQSDLGTLYYYPQANSIDGAYVVGAESNATISSGSGGSCSIKSPSLPSITAVTAIGGGYAVSWTENASSGARSYEVAAENRTTDAVTDFAFGNVTSGRIAGLQGNVSYNLTVVAIDPEGLAAVSPTSVGPRTLFALDVTPIKVRTSSSWAGATVNIIENTTGGEPRFLFAVDLGDGVTVEIGSTSGLMSYTYAYPTDFDGIAAIQISVVDAVGDSNATAPAYVPLQGTPLAVPAVVAGGDGFVELRWTPPAAPPGVPAVKYTIFWTTDAAWAPFLTAAWPGTALPGTGLIAESFGEVYLENWSQFDHYSIAVSPGTEVYATVVAWNNVSLGLLPAPTELGGPTYLVATATSFLASLAVAANGGAAPFVDQFNATFLLSPNDGLATAEFRFSVGSPVLATVQSYDDDWFANATVTFPSPGLVYVYLYVTDTIGQATVLSTTVYISTGPPPVVSIAQTPGPNWVNTTVAFSSTVTGGSGDYAYQWSFGDGATATTSGANESFPLPGSYLVTVSVTDLLWGGTSSTSSIIAIHSVPTIAIAEEATASDSTYRFVAVVYGAVGNLSYTWLFGDGTSASGATVTHTWPAPGNYTVELETQDRYGHTAIATTYSVVPSPSTSTTSGGTSTGLEETVGALVVLVIALAVVAAVLFVRGRRAAPPPGGEEAPAEFPAEGAPAYVEEAPPPGVEDYRPPE